MRIPILEYPKFEADDVIGTLACRAVEQGIDVVIVSSDKDMLQLVNDHVRDVESHEGRHAVRRQATEEFMGVKPSQVADLLALKGDTVDNIPGAPGIGEKGAKDLILRFGSVENAIEHAAEVETQDVSRKPAEPSRPDPAEQEAGDHPLRRAHRVCARCRASHASPTSRALREIYKTLEFSSLLREARTRTGAGRGARLSDARI